MQENIKYFVLFQNYLMETDHPTISITVLNEGQHSQMFNDALKG